MCLAWNHVLYWAWALSSIWGGNTSQDQVQTHWVQAQSSCAELFSVEELLTRPDFANCACKIKSREEIQTGENLRPTVKGLLFYQRRYYCTTVSGSRKILNQWKLVTLKWKKKKSNQKTNQQPFIMQAGTCCATALEWNSLARGLLSKRKCRKSSVWYHF